MTCPTRLFFTMDRRVQAAQLLGVLTDAEYRVVLHDVDEDTNLELLDKQVTNQATWQSIAAVDIDPADLTIGDDYEIRVITEFDALARVLVGGTFDYDNVLLRATKADTVPTDTDSDGVFDDTDNCVTTPNTDQADADDDGIGDACDQTTGDIDSDGVPDADDNCVTTPNTNQADADGDGTGDVCDSTPNGPVTDTDNDTIPDAPDNCDATVNTGQSDKDKDGIGDACDSTPNGARHRRRRRTGRDRQLRHHSQRRTVGQGRRRHRRRLRHHAQRRRDRFVPGCCRAHAERLRHR